MHPLAFESAFFRAFGLRERVDFITPEISFAQPLDGGRAGVAYRDLGRTAESLGRDGGAYERLLRPLSENAPAWRSSPDRRCCGCRGIR